MSALKVCSLGTRLLPNVLCYSIRDCLLNEKEVNITAFFHVIKEKQCSQVLNDEQKILKMLFS